MSSQQKTLAPGTRIQLIKKTQSGLIGCGVVVDYEVADHEEDDDVVVLVLDDHPGRQVEALRREVRLVK
jgi:hypothetical protein